MRISEEEKKAIEAKAKKYGFSSVSAYVKYVALNAEVTVTVKVKQKRGEPKVAVTTKARLCCNETNTAHCIKLKVNTMKNIYENMTPWEQRKDSLLARSCT